MMTKSKAFAHFGVKIKNYRWRWSDRTDDGKTVVLQLWKDQLVYKDGLASYNDYGDKYLLKQQNKAGNLARIEDIKWAKAHCDGLFNVVVGVCKDKDADPRVTVEAYPTKIVMKIIDFDEITGEFYAEMKK